jgi:hypothetical protein
MPQAAAIPQCRRPSRAGRRGRIVRGRGFAAAVAGVGAVKIASVLDLPDFAFVESLHGDRELVHDFVLPPGWRLDFAPGRFYAYRVADPDSRMVADLDPEVRFGQVSADGSRYVDLQATAGPDRRGSEFPPGWPPGRWAARRAGPDTVVA